MVDFWDAASCRYCLDPQSGRWHHHDGGGKLLWNVDQYLPDYTVQRLSRQPYSTLRIIMTLMTEAAITSETSVVLYQTTRLSIPEATLTICNLWRHRAVSRGALNYWHADFMAREQTFHRQRNDAQSYFGSGSGGEPCNRGSSTWFIIVFLVFPSLTLQS